MLPAPTANLASVEEPAQSLPPYTQGQTRLAWLLAQASALPPPQRSGYAAGGAVLAACHLYFLVGFGLSRLLAWACCCCAANRALTLCFGGPPRRLPGAGSLLPPGALRGLTGARLAQMLRSGDFSSGDHYEELLALDGGSSSTWRPAPEEAIRDLPTFIIGSHQGGAPDTCSICLEPLRHGESCKVLLCLHRHHGACLDRWLRLSGVCPVCKHPVQPRV